MPIKRWIGLIFLMSLFVILIMIRFSVYASNLSFSSYLNCYKGDIYKEQVTISPLYRTTSYNIGIVCNERHPDIKEEDIAVTPKLKNGYGFSVNDEFFIDSVTLEENGFYVIEVYPFYEEDGIYKPKKKQCLETFSVTVSIDISVELKKSNYYTWNYDSKDEFINKLLDNFDKDITLPATEKSKLMEAYDEANTYKRQVGKTFYVEYEKKSYYFTIAISSLEDGLMEYRVDINSNISKIKPLGFIYNSSYSGQYIEDIFSSYIKERIMIDLGIPSTQDILLDFANKQSYKKGYIILNVTIKDKVDAKNFAVKNLGIYILDSAELSNEDLKIEWESMSYYKEQNALNKYSTYIAFTKNEIAFYDYLDAPALTSYEIDISAKKLSYTLTYKSSKITRTEVISESSLVDNIKIVSRYNCISMNSKEDLAYKDQIGIKQGNTITPASKTKDYYLSYAFLEEGSTDYLFVCLYNSSTNEELDHKTIKIYYSREKNTNVFEKILKLYRDFLYSIF